MRDEEFVIVVTGLAEWSVLAAAKVGLLVSSVCRGPSGIERSLERTESRSVDTPLYIRSLASQSEARVEAADQ